MADLLAARSQMAGSLAFHIVFAVAGMAMPLMMVAAEAWWLRSGDPLLLDLTRRWARGTAILFAVGAVSGTVLSFELGLLWPRFMELAGPVIGMPFSLEGTAFFTEAIFLGIYLYGWGRVPRRAHLAAGVMVALSGLASAAFVVCANAWMNTPVGFRLATAGAAPGAGPVFAGIDPLRAMVSPAAMPQAAHMVLAAYAAVGMGVAGLHAAVLLRHPGDRFHAAALAVALWVGAPAALLQPLSGDALGQMLGARQPVKLAAMEGQWQTQAGAPLRLGGWPDEAHHRTRGALEIPHGLSLLAYHDPDAVVRGLDDVAPADRPPVAAVHLSFQAMVGLGSAMAAIAAAALGRGFLLARRRRRQGRGGGLWQLPQERWLLWPLAVAAPFGLLAIEAGWMVTELGRQPWIVQGLLRTRDAVTPMPGLAVPFAAVMTIYLSLGGVVAVLLRRHVRATMPAAQAQAGRGAGAPPAAGH